MKKIISTLVLLLITIMLWADPLTSSLKILGSVGGDTQTIILNKDDYATSVSSINNYISARNIIEEGKNSYKPNVQKLKLIKSKKLPIGYVVFATNENKNNFSISISYGTLSSGTHSLPYNIYLDNSMIPNNSKHSLSYLPSSVSGDNYSVFNVRIELKDTGVLYKGEYNSEIELTLIKD